MNPVPPVDFAAIEACLQICEPAAKCAAVESLWAAVEAHGFRQTGPGPRPIAAPGRPSRPQLVDPLAVPRRRLGSEAGRAALVHAVAHIEFNAINLALDAAYRFRGMPAAYYPDWLSVAADEARHFRMLEARLLRMGYHYGDFPAHNGLWQMAERTVDSCLERMALVPRVLEARGLDVTPGMIRKLRGGGDDDTIAALEVILAEEVRHVEIGSFWFRYCCEQADVEPESTFLDLLERRFAGRIKGPFNVAARLQAGFSPAELAALERLG